MWIVILLFILLNFYGYILMNLDKQKAIKREWRISERKLWIVSILGGALGAMIGMKQFRHKTKHVTFKYLLPLLSIITTGFYIFIIMKLV
ncbi:DUF1294 domain-containing protein [Cytobacillus sp. S13-E01]|uniref:DUF1294 domain-containing protein n=1 Tax=Cytobacillus sp. S13-E01 TaxID=3031326 RepID=UPI0023D88E00|nr:DUF1294 domain-containing protein [Cytobacillus sp. S13-E01]MDF0727481.1 DUF1294 domain-containing protein [Cytobacillus sp. S13-E01]